MSVVAQKAVSQIVTLQDLAVTVTREKLHVRIPVSQNVNQRGWAVSAWVVANAWAASEDKLEKYPQ